VKPGLQKIRFHSKNSKDADASASFAIFEDEKSAMLQEAIEEKP
jgi:hypothetical protein